MRGLMILLALVVTPFVASVSQGRGKPARPAHRAAAPAPRAAAQSGNCSQQQGQHEGNDACDNTPVPPPPPPPPPATCVAGSAPAGDVTVTGTVLQASPAVGLADWCVQLLENGVVVATAKTDGSGNYAFANIAAGTYMLCEVVQASWIQTFPTVAFTGAACASGNGGYAMNLPPLSQSPFNDFINGH